MAVKLFLHLPDDRACTIYRASMPLLHLYNDLSLHGIHITGDNKTLKYEDFDGYIFNRLIRPNFYNEVIAPWLERGKKFTWQCDDDLWRITKWNPVHRLLDANDLQATELYISKCDHAWVSTEPLKNVINAPGKTRVLPNLIDVNLFDSEIVHSTSGPLKILWCGGCSHEKDFDDIIQPLVRILEKYKRDIAVVFWGYLPTQLAAFEREPGFPHANLLPKYENLFYGEWFSIREYFYKLRDFKPDIAIMPLNDCQFNESKSNLKYLEMSMAGAACIATDLLPYKCIVDKETGIKVKPNDEQGWFDAMDELIQNKEYRLKLNQNAREQIWAKYTWNSPARQLWLNAFLDLAASTTR